VTLEEPFWASLREIAGLNNNTLAALIEQIDTDREHSNSSSAIRLFVLDYFKSQATDAQPEIPQARS
jgi:predicted DNA-binding ribbon-helix-helix protein